MLTEALSQGKLAKLCLDELQPGSCIAQFLTGIGAVPDCGLCSMLNTFHQDTAPQRLS